MLSHQSGDVDIQNASIFLPTTYKLINLSMTDWWLSETAITSFRLENGND